MKMIKRIVRLRQPVTSEQPAEAHPNFWMYL